MRNKIKKAVYSLFSIILVSPVLASAQLDTSVGGATGLPIGSFYSIVNNVMFWLLAIVGMAGVIGFSIAGILYLTAAGDETRMEKAKNAMLYSIIGVVVALAGLVALQFAKNMLGGTSKRF
ncbi:MAG TPA: hypothetical protein ENL05_00385 [Candidatus Moranbacteria bacterium]|nr:hypothetical protein [Candidatus Moranbacteria bacterium]